MRHLRSLIVVMGLIGSAPALAIDVPKQNVDKGTMPELAPAEAGARRILDAIVKNDPDAVADLFFPSDAFDALKDIKGAGAYYKKLVQWYVDDIRREHERVKGMGALEFDGFKKGGCVWKPIGSEYNKIAYWSCYKNHFYAKSAKGRVEFGLRAMINWGDAWYVTHLGPIPKQ